MQASFKSVRMTYFKSHESTEIEFNEVTKISGRNGIGKSSISEALTWLLFGVDMMGTKLDPTPLDAGEDQEPAVEALIEWQQEGGPVTTTLFSKRITKGKAAYAINDVPEKATAYEEAVAQLFGKDHFLSCFNPLYFFSQHWKEQRAQLLQYVSEPLDADVLAKIADKGKAEALAKATEKRSVSDVLKIYKPIYAESERKLERAAERWITLKEQLANAEQQSGEIDAYAVDEEKRQIEEDLAAAQVTNKKAQLAQSEAQDKDFELRKYVSEINRIKEQVIALQQQEIAESCRTCGQGLDAAAIETTKANRVAEIQRLSAEGRSKMEEYKKRAADPVAAPIQFIDTTDAQKRLYTLTSLLETAARLKPMAEDVKKAEQDKERIRQEYLEAQQLLDAVKLFDTAKSELMAEKVGGLFKNLSVCLENEAKNGTKTPAFEVEWSGRPYSKLSTAERIKAGLEIINVLASESGTVLPVFIDNAESILAFSKPAGQLITATVKNSHLVIKDGEEKSA